MKRLGLAALALVAASCDSGFAVSIEIDRGCAAEVDLYLELLPSQQATAVMIGPDSPTARVVVVIPDGGTDLLIDAVARDAAGPFGRFSTQVHVDGHSIDPVKVAFSTFCPGDMPLRDTGALFDLAGADLSGCMGDDTCPPSAPRCAPSGQCVACLPENDNCPAGSICVTEHCQSGCSSSKQACSDGGGLCDVDAGRCVACLNDLDCGGQTPRCDLSTGLCVVCLPTDDNCAAGSHCAMTMGSWECLAGCTNDAQCGAKKCCGAPNAGVCIDLQTDTSHCGSCVTSCSGENVTSVVCSGGLCTSPCVAGFGDCNADRASDGCETPLDTVTNCVSCGNKCLPNQQCAMQGCVWPPDMSVPPDLSLPLDMSVPSDLFMTKDFSGPSDSAYPSDLQMQRDMATPKDSFTPPDWQWPDGGSCPMPCGTQKYMGDFFTTCGSSAGMCPPLWLSTATVGVCYDAGAMCAQFGLAYVQNSAFQNCGNACGDCPNDSGIGYDCAGTSFLGPGKPANPCGVNSFTSPLTWECQ